MKDGNSSAFRYAEASFLRFVSEMDFLPALRGGATVALSGGADSVLLLFLLVRLAKKEGFLLSAVHVHHGIRGTEADLDAEFCRLLCQRTEIPFHCAYVDVPAYAKAERLGIEEAARILRYRAIDDAMAGFSARVAVTAHHAGDNLETMMLNLARGTGITGLTGIPPRRGHYLRPLLSLGKKDIVAALLEIGETFVTDSTNSDRSFSRNFIREEILPPLLSRMPHAESAATRAAHLLRRDAEYLENVAEGFVSEHFERNGFSREAFSSLHPAIASRAFLLAKKMAFPEKLPVPEQKHVDRVISLARFGNTDFCVNLPGGVSAIGERGRIYFRLTKSEPQRERVRLGEGETLTPDGNLLVLRNEKNPEFIIREKIVYKLLKQISLNRDTIIQELYLRHRLPADAYRFGGMRRRVNTLLSDAKMTASEKDALWLLCDAAGILWVPNFGIRDGCKGDTETLAFYRKDEAVTS